MAKKRIKIPNPFANLKRFRVKNLKIASKLYLSYALILIFLILVGGSSLLFITQLGQTTQELYEERFQYVTEMISLTHSFEQLNGAVSSALLQTNALGELERIEALEASIKEKISSIKENHRNFDISEEDIKSFDLVWIAYENGLRSVKEWIEQSSGDSQLGMGMAVGTFNTQLTIRITTLNQYLNQWVEHNTQLADQSYTESQAAQSTILTIQIALVIAAIILSGIVGTLIARTITKPLHRLTEAANSMAEGQLNQRIELDRNDEIGQLASTFNHMSSNIRELIKQVKWTGEQVASSSQILSTNMSQMNDTSEQIAVTIHEVAEGSTKQADHASQILSKMETTMETIEQGLHLVDDSLEKASKSTSVAYEGDKAITEAIEHLQVVTETVTNSTVSIHKLGELSEKIGSIIHVITDISNQTNLLALNAAIEAARAGEHGKGFAVVADEVRKLAEQSNQSAQQIIQLVNEIQQETSNSIHSMENSNAAVKDQVSIIQKGGNALKEIIENVVETESGTRQLQSNFTNIKQNIDDVLQSIQEISSIIEESAASAEQVASGSQEQSATVREIASNSEELARMAESLEQEVRKFQI